MPSLRIEGPAVIPHPDCKPVIFFDHADINGVLFVITAESMPDDVGSKLLDAQMQLHRQLVFRTMGGTEFLNFHRLLDHLFHGIDRTIKRILFVYSEALREERIVGKMNRYVAVPLPGNDDYREKHHRLSDCPGRPDISQRKRKSPTENPRHQYVVEKGIQHYDEIREGHTPQPLHIILQHGVQHITDKSKCVNPDTIGGLFEKADVFSAENSGQRFCKNKDNRHLDQRDDKSEFHHDPDQIDRGVFILLTGYNSGHQQHRHSQTGTHGSRCRRQGVLYRERRHRDVRRNEQEQPVDHDVTKGDTEYTLLDRNVLTIDSMFESDIYMTLVCKNISVDPEMADLTIVLESPTENNDDCIMKNIKSTFKFSKEINCKGTLEIKENLVHYYGKANFGKLGKDLDFEISVNRY